MESAFQPMKDLALEDVLQRTVSPERSIPIKRIEQLLDLIRKEQPRNLELVLGAIESYRPLLVLNRVSPSQDPDAIVATVRNVSRQMLSLEVDYLGHIPFSPEMERSAFELVPVVAKYPGGELAQIIAELIA